MAYAAMKPTKPGLEEPQEAIHKIRITLSSKNVKNLEKGLFLILTCYYIHLMFNFFRIDLLYVKLVLFFLVIYIIFCFIVISCYSNMIYMHNQTHFDHINLFLGNVYKYFF